MTRRIMIFVGLLILGLQIAGCALSSGGSGAPAAPATEKAKPVAEDWQQKWNKLQADAKGEGKVVIATSAGPVVRDAFTKAFTGKFGVNMEFIVAKPEETVPKLVAERRAGMYLVDMLIGGVGPPDSLGADGELERLDGALILPEVLDKKAWWNGDLAWVDPNHYHVMFLAMPRAPLTINTDFVKPDEIKSYRDLLNPKWQGKITYFDPTISGAGRETFSLLGESLGKDFLVSLGKQEPVISRDGRQMIEWVARGKYPIGVGIVPELQIEFKKAGAPIKTVTPVEGTFISGAGAGLVYLTKAPHPNAAGLFANWLLSKEGEVVASEAFGGQSAREDVPTGSLEPEVIRQPGVKYMPALTLEYLQKADGYVKMAKDIWGPLLK